MKATIEVAKQQAAEYLVTIIEGDSRTSHTVTAQPDYIAKLTGGNANAEDLIRHSFEFLLEHEPKESILRSFGLPVIGHYFPEYEEEIRRRVSE